MGLRMIEIVLGADAAVFFQEPLGDVQIGGLWRLDLCDGTQLIRILVESDQTEKVLDICSERYGSLEEFHCIVFEVGAFLPRPEEDSEEDDKSREPEKKSIKGKRISREELHANIEGPAETTTNFLALIGLSTIVAALGLMRGNVAVIIGAMVIAPLLGPNMALSLATLLGDSVLARRAIKSILIGITEATIIAFLLGLALEVDENAVEMVSRTQVGIGDVTLALCAGAAGALSFTGGISSALVGVMVAVALLPPLTTCGLLLAVQNWYGASGAALLFLINMVCINLSGVMVFRLQGIRPGDQEHSRGALVGTVAALAFWTVMLLVIIWFVLHKQAP